jgi:hypothetical protein
MGAMKDYQIAIHEIEELYEGLISDEEVVHGGGYRPVLLAAEAVLGADPREPSPYPLDLVRYALYGVWAAVWEGRRGER